MRRLDLGVRGESTNGDYIRKLVVTVRKKDIRSMVRVLFLQKRHDQMSNVANDDEEEPVQLTEGEPVSQCNACKVF